MGAHDKKYTRIVREYIFYNDSCEFDRLLYTYNSLEYNVFMLTIAEKHKIQRLRSDGLTYQEIIDLLGKKVPKSTLSYICRNTVLPGSYFTKIKALNLTALSNARIKAIHAKQDAREELLREVTAQNSKYRSISQREAMLALAYLYLGEGLKRSPKQRGLKLGSSNPTIVTTYIGLLKRCYNIDVSKLKCRISYRADQNLDDLQKFWSYLTGISINNFYKTIPDPRTVGKPTNNKEYKGVCAIYCSGSRIQLELQVITDIINEEMGY